MKYQINKEFGIFRSLRPPLNKFVLRLALAMPKCLRPTKSIAVERCVAQSNGYSVPLYVFSPKGAKEKLPTVFFLHGGGFVFKGASHHYRMAKMYAEKIGAKVVFVDYRLAFQANGQACVEDCFAAYCHVLERADKLHLDVGNIGLIGDSAGGYLALALCKMLSERNVELPKYQMLVYPVVDPQMSTQSAKEFVDTPMWNGKANAKMWEIFGEGEVYNPLCDNLSFMPATYVETAQFDCLHDEGVLLHEKLLSFGVDSKLNQTVGTMHGFDACHSAKTTQAVVDERLKILKEFVNS